MSIVATRKVANGIIVKKICPSCQHGFWTHGNAPRNECADCDPPVREDYMKGIGRNMDRKRSDHQYHGCYQE